MKILRDEKNKKFVEMGTPDHISCCLRNLYAGQKATVRTGHGIMNWFKIGKKRSTSRLSTATLLI